MDACVFRRLLHLFLTGRGISHADIILHSIMKEEAVLKYIGNQLGQPRRRNIADVHTPNADTPLLRLIETQDQLRQSGLPAAGRPYQPRHTVCRQTERHIPDRLRSLGIRKRDLLKGHIISGGISRAGLADLVLHQNPVNTVHALDHPVGIQHLDHHILHGFFQAAAY